MPITADFHIQLLSAIHKVQGECIDGSHAVELFDGLLNELLDLTSSEYGFIGEALHNGTQPYLKTYAITDISWNEETRSFYESNAPQGLEFLNLDTLFGAVIKSHRPVISNSPVTDPRAGGVPPGHPPLLSFLGLPLLDGEDLLGMVGIANRPGGYGQDLIQALSPFLSTCTSLIRAHSHASLRRVEEERRRQLEQQLFRTQKLDAVGRLAGGVAHDLNNLLCAVDANIQAMRTKNQREDLPADLRHAYGEIVGDMQEATDRAGSLMRQLLSLSRKELSTPEPVDPSALLVDLQRMLGQLLGRSIEVVVDVDESTPIVHIDPGQLEQVVLNLALNARDAMQSGGTLTLGTRAESRSHRDLTSHADARPGLYSVLSVRDTGEGIDPELQARIFDPFFTTKENGHGSGLGLAIVDGIVGQSGGHVELESTPGSGTEFRIYLPATRDDSTDLPAPAESTILVCEDDPLVRDVVQRILERSGYAVLVAGDGRAALDTVKARGHEIDLVITDMVLPRLTGPALAERLRRFIPELPVIFMTGYEIQDVEGRVTDNVLPKPFRPDTLLSRVEVALN